jgi:hypothetical protein
MHIKNMREKRMRKGAQMFLCCLLKCDTVLIDAGLFG